MEEQDKDFDLENDKGTDYACPDQVEYVDTLSFGRSLPNGNCLFGTAYFSLVGDNSLVHELGIMAGVELHLNASYARHPALKSFSEKTESVIGDPEMLKDQLSEKENVYGKRRKQ